MTFPKKIRAGDYIQWRIPASQDVFGNAISINKGSTLGLILVMPIIFPAVILFGQALTFLRLEIPIFSIHFMATGISIIACILLTFVTAITLKLHLE